ncbi:MAG: DUF2851 family protein [Candidatus Kapaibacteriales bacterium]
MEFAQTLTKSMNEFALQKKVHKLFSEPSNIFWTKSKKRLQILSPGRLNREEGPDYLDIAILLNGMVIIGDAEFHLKSSDWILHNHSNDIRYQRVCLHIVLEDDASVNENFEVLQINLDDLAKIKNEVDDIPNFSSDIVDELQNYALIRLLRKTNEARFIFENFDPITTFKIVFRNFLIRTLNRRHRPHISRINLDDFVNKLVNSNFFLFYEKILKGVEFNIPEALFSLMKTKNDLEGNHLRREMIMNCLLPLSIAIANDNSRISLFAWFWSTPALNSYGVLTRKFPLLPQNYIWQQQGMLEILSNPSQNYSSLSSSILQFKVGELLSFFHIGNPSY